MSVKDTECYRNVKDGKCKIYQKFPHPIFLCSIDEHEAMAIIDMEQMLEHMHNKCPLKEQEHEQG